MAIPTNTIFCYDCENVETINSMGFCNSHKQRLQYVGTYGKEHKNLYYKAHECPHLNDPTLPISYTSVNIPVSIPNGPYCKDCTLISIKEHDTECAVTGNLLKNIRLERVVNVTKDISDCIINYEYIKDTKCPNKP